MESLIEFYFRLFEYIKANWRKYIEIFNKMIFFEKIIQCLLFVIELIIIFYLTVEIAKDIDSRVPFVSFVALLLVVLVHQYFHRKTKNFKINLFLSYFEVFYLSIFNLFFYSTYSFWRKVYRSPIFENYSFTI